MSRRAIQVVGLLILAGLGLILLSDRSGGSDWRQQQLHLRGYTNVGSQVVALFDVENPSSTAVQFHHAFTEALGYPEANASDRVRTYLVTLPRALPARGTASVEIKLPPEGTHGFVYLVFAPINWHSRLVYGVEQWPALWRDRVPMFLRKVPLELVEQSFTRPNVGP